MAVAALIVCGILHIVGSDRDITLVLDDGRRRVALAGAVADTLVGSTWHHVCVEGERTAQLAIGAAYTMRVDRVRAAGDGRHAPLVGILRRSRHAWVIEVDRGRRFVLRRAPSDAALFAGRRVWLVGRWKDAAFTVTSIGPF